MTSILDKRSNAEALRNFAVSMYTTTMKRAVKAKARREYNRNIRKTEEWAELNTRLSMQICGVKS